MNNFKSNYRGFTIVEALVVVFIVGLLAFAGYYVYTTSQNDETADVNSTSQQPESSDEGQSETSTPEINNGEDLQQAEEFVNDTNIDKSLDTSEIDEAIAN